MLDAWIKDVLKTQPITENDSAEHELAKKLVDACYDLAQKQTTKLGVALAGAFDLFVSAKYYSELANTGWIYCPGDEPRVFYPYVNACPRDAIGDRFYYHPANKLGSGMIGKHTAESLQLFYHMIFSRRGMDIKIFNAKEPMDAIMIDENTMNVLLLEIKASPLLTLPLSRKFERVVGEGQDGITEMDHCTVTIEVIDRDLEVLVPRKEGGVWVDRYHTIGRKRSEEWCFAGMSCLLGDGGDFFTNYMDFWQAALDAYTTKSKSNIFWFTNACGGPRKWLGGRKGTTVSDSKTSVGMDRTDDIKKASYQMIKIGAEKKTVPSTWTCTTAILSNIHAIRHNESLVRPVENVLWAEDDGNAARVGNSIRVGDLPKDKRLYDLFDGMITLTRVSTKNDWIRNTFRYAP